MEVGTITSNCLTTCPPFTKTSKHAHSFGFSVKGQLAAQQSSLGGQLAQAQMAKGYFDELKANKASKEDKDKYTGSSILKKLAFTAIKAVQVYIVLQITNQAGMLSHFKCFRIKLEKSLEHTRDT